MTEGIRDGSYPDDRPYPNEPLRPFINTVFETIKAHFTASGMEAPSGGETGTGSTEGDSPVGKAETPKA